jgi:hypothetical protein
MPALTWEYPQPGHPFCSLMAYCPSCRREVFQTADGELRNCEIGPLTKAAAVYLRHEVKLSYRDVRKVFTGLFGIPFVPASAMATVTPLPVRAKLFTRICVTRSAPPISPMEMKHTGESTARAHSYGMRGMLRLASSMPITLAAQMLPSPSSATISEAISLPTAMPPTTPSTQNAVRPVWLI